VDERAPELRVAVVIPTLDRRDSLAETLDSLGTQTLRPDVYVVDNASTDGTSELVAERFPEVTLVRNEENLGFGAAIDRVALSLDADVLVLVNNDVVCEPEFIERIVEPLADPRTAMAGAVLLQYDAPDRIDSAGLELDPTLGAWDLLWDQPLGSLDGARQPVGPCGGAAAYRLSVYKEHGGFDDRLFAYWEDAELAIRLQMAGFSCALASGARALHKHGATLGVSPAQRSLHAFGRGYVMGKFGVSRSPLRRLQSVLLDWPTLLVHLVVRRELEPIRARRRGLRSGRSARVATRPPRLASITLRDAIRRQAQVLGLRVNRELPKHFYET
jgi:N-acetylglucosaminyl-diphospho-decaprenol L-rhamnosyltransferase